MQSTSPTFAIDILGTHDLTNDTYKKIQQRWNFQTPRGTRFIVVHFCTILAYSVLLQIIKVIMA